MGNFFKNLRNRVAILIWFIKSWFFQALTLITRICVDVEKMDCFSSFFFILFPMYIYTRIIFKHWSMNKIYKCLMITAGYKMTRQYNHIPNSSIFIRSTCTLKIIRRERLAGLWWTLLAGLRALYYDRVNNQMNKAQLWILSTKIS